MTATRTGNTRMVNSVALEAMETWVPHQEKKAVDQAPMDYKVLENARERHLNWALRLEKAIDTVKAGKPLILPKPIKVEAPKLKVLQAKSVTVSPKQLQEMIADGIAEDLKKV